MSKNAKAVREAIEQRRLRDQQEPINDADGQIDDYSSDYGEEEGPQEEEHEESSDYGNEQEEEEKVQNPLLAMTAGIGQQL